MLARIAKVWRALRSGIGFASFGLMSVWLAAVWLPFRGYWDRRTPEPWRRAQRAIHNAYSVHMGVMEVMGIIRVRWIDAERLGTLGHQLIVANHPSLIDVVLIISKLPQADCIMNSDYAENRWLRGAARAADYIRNDAGAEVVRQATRRLSEGRTLVIFPEGTRSPEGGLGRFQRGAAHIALEAGLDMLPVHITVEPPMLMKGQKWYHVTKRRSLFTLRVGEPIVAKEHLDGGESTVMAARKLTAVLRARFEGGCV